MFDSEALLNEFVKGKMSCVRGHEARPFEVLRYSLEAHFMGMFMVAVGSNITAFIHDIEENTDYALNVHDFGIPEDASIFDVNWTPHGAIPCNEVRGNTRRQRNTSGNLVYHAGAKRKDLVADVHRIGIFVTWIPAVNLKPGMGNLVAAFTGFHDEDFEDAIIPAQVAVEAALYNLMLDRFSPHVGVRNLESFLHSACTYGHQLNVMLPFITATESLPPLPPHILGALRSLKEVRDQIAHQGFPKSELTKKKMAEFLSATILGYKYITVVTHRPDLLRRME